MASCPGCTLRVVVMECDTCGWSLCSECLDDDQHGKPGITHIVRWRNSANNVNAIPLAESEVPVSSGLPWTALIAPDQTPTDLFITLATELYNTDSLGRLDRDFFTTIYRREVLREYHLHDPWYLPQELDYTGWGENGGALDNSRIKKNYSFAGIESTSVGHLYLDAFIDFLAWRVKMDPDAEHMILSGIIEAWKLPIFEERGPLPRKAFPKEKDAEACLRRARAEEQMKLQDQLDIEDASRIKPCCNSSHRISVDQCEARQRREREAFRQAEARQRRERDAFRQAEARRQQQRDRQNERTQAAQEAAAEELRRAQMGHNDAEWAELIRFENALQTAQAQSGISQSMMNFQSSIGLNNYSGPNIF